MEKKSIHQRISIETVMKLKTQHNKNMISRLASEIWMLRVEACEGGGRH